MISFYRASLASVCVVLAACSSNEPSNVEFREQDPAETAAAARIVFSESLAPELPTATSTAIDGFFTRLGHATRAEGEIEVGDFISGDAIFESLSKSGVLDGLEGRQLAAFKRGFLQGLGSFSTSLKHMAFDEHRLLRVEQIDDNEVLAYVRHYDNRLNVTAQIRWWLVETSKGWQVYDFEDLSGGFRVVSFMGLMAKSGLSEVPEPWVDQLISTARQFQTIDPGDPESLLSMEEPLLELRSYDLPEMVNRFASMLMASIHQVKGEPEASIEELEAAVKGGYNSPLHHYLMGSALMRLGRYEEALLEFHAHADYLGWDSDVLELVSDSHFWLGQMREAREAALRGLEDNPRSINCLASLAAASSPEEIQSDYTASLFAASGDAAWAYEVALDYTIEIDRLPQAKALFEHFKAEFPDDELLAYYTEVLKEPEIVPSEE